MKPFRFSTVKDLLEFLQVGDIIKYDFAYKYELCILSPKNIKIIGNGIRLRNQFCYSSNDKIWEVCDFTILNDNKLSEELTVYRNQRKA